MWNSNTLKIRRLGYGTIEALIIDKRADGLPYSEIAEISQVPIRTLYRYVPNDAKGAFAAVTEKRRRHTEELIRRGLDALRVKRFNERRKDGTTRREMSLREMEKVRNRLFK